MDKLYQSNLYFIPIIIIINPILVIYIICFVMNYTSNWCYFLLVHINIYFLTPSGMICKSFWYYIIDCFLNKKIVIAQILGVSVMVKIVKSKPSTSFMKGLYFSLNRNPSHRFYSIFTATESGKTHKTFTTQAKTGSGCCYDIFFF